MNSKLYPENISPVNLAELKSVEQKLVSEINHLHHELRRVKDGLERAGGSAHELEKRARQLSGNIELCENDLRAIREKQLKHPIHQAD